MQLKYSVFIAALIFSLSSLEVSGQGFSSGDDLLKEIRRFGQAEVEIAYPGFAAMTQLAARFSVSSCDGKKAILSLSPLTVNDFISTRAPFVIHTREGTKSVYTASSVAEAMLWRSYPTWQQYDTIMHLLASRWPEVCKLDTIGFSVLGRAILVLKISDNPFADGQKPAVMFSSSIHGDELAGFVLMMRLAEKLTSESHDGGLIESLVSGLEIWINPLSNPDGMYRTGDTIIYPVRSNNNGYDINRNFPDPEVTGPPPLQPETTCMINFMRQKHFVLSANLHSGVEVVNYPWDKWTRLHADDQWFYEISRRYADTVHLNAESGYLTYLNNGITRGSVWYLIRGGRQDYVTYELGGREITIELDDIKQTAAPDLESLWNYNNRSFLRLLEETLFSIHGVVTDAETGLPLGAKIFIQNHDVDSSHVYSDTLTGSFIRLISPGIWDLIVTCDGYRPFIAEDISVSWNEATWLDIELTPVDTIPPPPVSGLLIYPVPSAGPVKILLPDQITGDVMVTVTSVSGTTIMSYRTTVIKGIPIKNDLSYLGSGIYIVRVKKIPDGPVVRGKLIINGLTP